MASKDKTNKSDIVETIEASLEERTGKDRRKDQVSTPFLNPALERRKNDRRSRRESQQQK
jgi:hypothetical protein